MQDREIWTTAQSFVGKYGQAAIFEALRLAHGTESGPAFPVSDRWGADQWRLVAFAARQILDTPAPGQRPH